MLTAADTSFLAGAVAISAGIFANPVFQKVPGNGFAGTVANIAVYPAGVPADDAVRPAVRR